MLETALPAADASFALVGPDGGMLVPGGSGFALVGVGEHCDLRVREPTVSRSHAALVLRQGVPWIRDLDSRNGTFVNGVRVREAELGSDVEVRFGALPFLVRGRPAPVPAPRRSYRRLIGASLAMAQPLVSLEQALASDRPVLVSGEPGTGKSTVARILHEETERQGAFVEVRCARVAPGLAAARLFGGDGDPSEAAWTEAHDGTLHLHEVAALPLGAQRALAEALRALPDGAMRVVASTTADIGERVARGAFRADLYRLLSTHHILLPPLRERERDVARLIAHFDRAERLGPDREAIADQLGPYGWPGNVSELKALVEHAFVVGLPSAIAQLGSARPESTAADLRALVVTDLLDSEFAAFREAWLQRGERAYLAAHLEAREHNVAAVARRIGLNRTYLHKLVRRYGL